MRNPTAEGLQVKHDHQIRYAADDPKKGAARHFGGHLKACCERKPAENLENSVDQRADGINEFMVIG
jgi:hypothetical protein